MAVGAPRQRRRESAERLALRLPRVPGLVTGALCLLLGGFMALRLFSSLAVLVVLTCVGLVLAGIGELASGAAGGRRGRGDRSRWAWAGVLVVAGVVGLVRPGLTVHALVVVTGAGLVVSGLVELVQGVRGRASRWVAVVSGSASVGLGVLALAWPDVTVVVLAVLLGLRIALFGVDLLMVAWRGPRGGARVSRGPVRAVASLVVVAALLVVGTLVHGGVPVPDAFYSAPATAPSQLGRLLRAEPFTRDVPAAAHGWRILYTTTREAGQPAVASALVVVPRAASSSPPAVIAWAHGTTGAAPACAPSLQEHPFESGALFLTDQVVAHGWALVATDYVGLGTAGPHPYLVGEAEGRSVLDAVRAAHQLSGVTLGTDTVVWGHSQGGHAALWTGVLGPTYAPDVHLDGIAALAPASNLPALVEHLGGSRIGSMFASYVATAYGSVYDDVQPDDYIRPGARLIMREMGQRCLSNPGVLVSLGTALSMDKAPWHRDVAAGAFGERLTQNTPTGAIAVPLLIAQGLADTLVTPSSQDAYVQQRCAAGQAVDYRTYAGRGHVELVTADSPLVPDLLAWTQDRLAGVAPTSTCPAAA